MLFIIEHLLRVPMVQIKYISIDEASKFLSSNDSVQLCLRKLIKHSIAEKRVSFSNEAFKVQHELLEKFKLVTRESESVFQLDYNNLVVCHVLAQIAVETLGEEIPEDPIESLKYAQRFAEEIRKPTIRTFWYSDLEINLEGYILAYLHQVKGIDITAFVESVTTEMSDQTHVLRTINSIYSHAIPYLAESTEATFTKITGLLANEKTKWKGTEAIRNICKINPLKAVELYNFGKVNRGLDFTDFFSTMLLELYPLDNKYYLAEAIELFNGSQIQSLHAMSWFEYPDANQINVAFEFIYTQQEIEIECLREIPTFYTRLVSNRNTSDEIREKCFVIIKQLAKNEDEKLRNNLAFRTGLIKGYDERKYDLLADFMAWGKPYFLRDYFNYFDSPHLLFDLIRISFQSHGMHVDLDLLKEAISTQFHKNQEECSKELLMLLSDEVPVIRFAGIQVLMSGHGEMYKVNFLELDEMHQIRIIETLLPIPINIEELLPLVLSLKNSPFITVKQKLELGLIDLIGAFDYNLITLAKQHLDDSVEIDKGILAKLNEAYSIYEKEKKAKSECKELDPTENELEYIDLYFRLEHEKSTEMMEHAQSQTFFAQMAKTVHVIRGGAFNSEMNSDIAPMGKVELSRLIDQRYFINPDLYEWKFKMNATGKKSNI